MRVPVLVAATILLTVLTGCAKQAPPAELNIKLQLVAEGFDSPVFATVHRGVDYTYVVEQKGVIRVVNQGTVLGTPFLDITDRVGSGGERGLLGLAFGPDFEADGDVFVHYTDKDGDTVLERFHATSATKADKAESTVFLQVDQPYANHNGGMITFGPDGYLYMGLGDGGSGGDPQSNGQKLTTLLGKILRLDVSGDAPTCPPTNPKLGDGTRCEIWSYGLRNPWRFSFDQQTGDIFIGDVGQNQWEEIDYSPGSPRVGGENYGWNVFEGTHRFRSDGIEDHVRPIAEYATGPDGTCSVTGGYVYRGANIPELEGRYVFGDYCNGKIWILERDEDSWDRLELLDTDLRLSSFGEDGDGELLVIDHGGAVYRLVNA